MKKWFLSRLQSFVVNEDISIDPGENRAFIKNAPI
jgi:hypothetical protein